MYDPKATTGLKDVLANAEEKVDVICEAEGLPKPTVTWKKLGSESW